VAEAEAKAAEEAELAPPPIARQPSGPPSEAHPSSVLLGLQRSGEWTLATVTPPQTHDATVAPTSGAHCLVLDISGSMGSDATVTNDDGDKVSHGWSQLDIVKHAACTYVQSLGDSDFVCIVTYGSRATHVVRWRPCTKEGKEELDTAIRGLRIAGTTNMVEGIEFGFQAFTNLPEEVAAAPSEYAMLLAVCTDGMPDNRSHDYQRQVQMAKQQVEERHGPTAVPRVTSIAFGNSLDSTLLNAFADVFLHIPDPGSVGPFMVNLVAATRSTAKLAVPVVGNVTANKALLILEPASAVEWVPAFNAVPWRNGAAVAVDLGAMQYDQPRHLLLQTSGDVQATLEISGHEVANQAKVLELADPADAAFNSHIDRAAVVCALQTVPTPVEALAKLGECLAPGPLKETVMSEALLAVQPDKFSTWGRHYVVTLPIMLRLERRSNFRDICLQGYGKDARGREGLFEQLSNDAEMVFATLKPPEPSAKRRGGGGGGGGSGGAVMTRMPDEFMRGGGCFGPLCRVEVLADGVVEKRPLCKVSAGDLVRVAGGGFARVVCLVHSPCPEGHALMRRVGRLTITEWHPVLMRGAWHYPAVVGEPVEMGLDHVINLVLASTHMLLVEGILCVTLGHQLTAPVAAHPFYGSDAVLDVLRAQDGWASGRVVLESPLRC